MKMKSNKHKSAIEDLKTENEELENQSKFSSSSGLDRNNHPYVQNLGTESGK